MARQGFRGRRRAFEFGTMLSFAIPGTVVGVSYVAAFNVPPVDITGTMIILVISFAFRNMPVGMRAGMAALAQIDPQQWRRRARPWGRAAAQTLGRSRAAADAARRIFTALVYAFVTAMTAVSAVISRWLSARHNMATAYIPWAGSRTANTLWPSPIRRC